MSRAIGTLAQWVRRRLAEETAGKKAAKQLWSGYDAPSHLPQREFELDYPNGYTTGADGRLLTDIEGRTFGRGRVVGRVYPDQGDYRLQNRELEPVVRDLTGKPITVSPDSAMDGDSGRMYYGALGPEEIEINKRLKPGAVPKVVQHEVGHAISDIAGSGSSNFGINFKRDIPIWRDHVKTPAESAEDAEVARELKQVYNDLNNTPLNEKRALHGDEWEHPGGAGAGKFKGTTPHAFGYGGGPRAESEYVAEGFRAYMSNPNYLKSVAPKFAARVREFVNNNPRLRDIIQFNMQAGGAMTLGALAATQSEEADAGIVTRGGKKIIEAWHGSPYTFDRFDISRIGTGEGAQVYGHGLYFADEPSTARSYIKGDGKMVHSWLKENPQLQGKIRADLQALYPTTPAMYLDPATIIRDIQAGTPGKNSPYRLSYGLEDMIRQATPLKMEGGLYKAELDVDPRTLFKWDETIDHQPIEVQEALTPLYLQKQKEIDDLVEDPAFRGSLIDDMHQWTGGGWMSELNTLHSSLNNALSSSRRTAPAMTADFFLQNNVPGVQYLDGMSRRKGEGTYNYVMFDDKPIRILERGNADPRLLAGTAGVATLGVLAASQSGDADAASNPAKREAMRLMREKATAWGADDTDWWHGSTWGIGDEGFDASKGFKKGDWGPGVYKSNSLPDVMSNYTGIGPDLQQRIYMRADDLLHYFPEMDDRMRLKLATDELVGDAGRKGVTYPLRLDSNGFARIGWDETGSTIMRANDMDGALALQDRLYNSLRLSDLGKLDDDSVDFITDEVGMGLMDTGELNLRTLDRYVRDAFDPFDFEGDINPDMMPSGGAMSAQTLQGLGFPGVIDTGVSRKFPGMNQMDSDTVHAITFPGNENRIRSPWAKFDLRNKHLRNTLAGITGTGIIANQTLNPDRVEALGSPYDFTNTAPVLPLTPEQQYGTINAPGYDRPMSDDERRYGVLSAPMFPGLAKGVEYMNEAERRLDGSPAGMVFPGGFRDWADKLSYNKPITWWDRFFAAADVTPL